MGVTIQAGRSSNREMIYLLLPKTAFALLFLMALQVIGSERSRMITGGAGVQLFVNEIPLITTRYGFGIIKEKSEHQGVLAISFLPDIGQAKGEYPGGISYLYYQWRRSFLVSTGIYPTLMLGVGSGVGATRNSFAIVPFIPMIGIGVGKRWEGMKATLEARSDAVFVNGIIFEIGWLIK